MSKLKLSFKIVFLSLVIICAISGVVFAGINRLTKDSIEQTEKAKLENVIREIIPGFDNNPIAEMYKIALTQNDTAIIYPAKKGENIIGVAVETQTMKGYNGEIRILTGLDNNGKVLNYKVLHHTETDGFGDKMDTWFKTEKDNQNIIGKNLSQQTLKLSKDGGEIDAITTATISSRAFLDAVNKSYAAYSGNIDSTSASEVINASSGATN